MELPSWSSMFSSLKPYEDPNEVDSLDFEEAGDPRFGIVQLTSTSTTYNATLNLTGHILLGLGIASSVLLYMFFQAFKGSNSGYTARHDNYRKNVQSHVDGFTPTKCLGSLNEKLCIESHRNRLVRSAPTSTSPAVLYLPLGGPATQGCPSTAETAVLGISQMVFLWTVMSVFSAVGNVVANINNNQNNNNNNDNNVNLNIVSTQNTQISANTNNANTISIMLPPPIPILAGGRKLEAEMRLKRFVEMENNRKSRNLRTHPGCSQSQSISNQVALIGVDILKFLFKNQPRVFHQQESRDCLGKRLCQLQNMKSDMQGSYLENAMLKIARFALMYVELDDRSQAFLQFMESMNTMENSLEKPLNCNETFWKCSSDDD